MNRPRILLIGYGNPARGDDGLGPAVARAVEAWALPNVTVDSAYQLTVEDAAEVANYEMVIFADASLDAPEPFSFSRVEPAPDAGFSSHHMEPSAIMALAASLFNTAAAGYVLGIRGYAFDMFCETFSAGAQANLDAALAFLDVLLREGEDERSDCSSTAAASAGCREGVP